MNRMFKRGRVWIWEWRVSGEVGRVSIEGYMQGIYGLLYLREEIKQEEKGAKQITKLSRMRLDDWDDGCY